MLENGFCYAVSVAKRRRNQQKGSELLTRYFAFRSMSIRLIHASQPVVPLGIAT